MAPEYIRRKRKVGALTLELTHRVKSGGVQIDAMGDAEDPVGTMRLETRPYESPLEEAAQVFVTGAHSDNVRGSRVGTRMYEMAADYTCEYGLPLMSDFMRSKPAEAFWRKQYDKGRADHLCSKDYFKKPKEAWSCPPDKRKYDETGSSVLESEYRTQGIISQYKLKACGLPSNLEGVRRRKRRRR